MIGTRVIYKPGFIVGGKIVHDCGNSRGIGYFLEPLMCLAPFGKAAVHATLKGITNNEEDISVVIQFRKLSDLMHQVDIMKRVTMPLLKHFGLEEAELDLKVI
jgi:RNA 3'-terminal phosphate cyclase-like protein